MRRRCRLVRCIVRCRLVAHVTLNTQVCLLAVKWSISNETWPKWQQVQVVWCSSAVFVIYEITCTHTYPMASWKHTNLSGHSAYPRFTHAPGLFVRRGGTLRNTTINLQLISMESGHVYCHCISTACGDRRLWISLTRLWSIHMCVHVVTVLGWGWSLLSHAVCSEIRFSLSMWEALTLMTRHCLPCVVLNVCVCVSWLMECICQIGLE